MVQIQTNGMRLEVETHGERSGPPLLLIRGLGSQIIHWPPAMIEALVDDGWFVIAYDNRDAGLSGASSGSYTVGDMAADGVGVLDALGVASADIFGISMGGMIAQEMAWAHGDRIRSATIVMSSSGAPDLPARSPEIEKLLLETPPADASTEEIVEATLKADRVWAGPAFPFDEAERRALIARAVKRAWRPEGVMRQYQAVLASAGRADRLAEIRTPGLVIHGDRDALLPLEHGADIAARWPGAVFQTIEGMGHDLDGGAYDPVLDAFRAFTAKNRG